MVFDEAPGIDYAFDLNADESVWHRPPGSSLMQNNHNDDLPFSNGIIEQDFNNNDGISFDDGGFKNDNDNNNNNNRVQLLRREYSYQVFSNIRNFWAGPWYWKYSKNVNQSKHAPSVNGNQSGRRKKKQPIKPKFDGDDGESSTDEYFIKTTSKAAKKLRRCNRALWHSERLKLPPQCTIPSDLFDKQNYNRQSEDSMESNQMENYDVDDNDFGVSSCVPCIL